MEQWEFIEKAASELGFGPEAIRKWRVRGVPMRHRLQICDIAARDEFPLDRGCFDDPPGPRSRASATGEAA